MTLARTRLCLGVALAMMTAAPALAQDDNDEGRERPRRQFDIKAFVNKLDQNQNGYLEPGEMSDRTKRFIDTLGFKTDQPVKVDLIIKKVNRAKAEAQEEQRRKLLEANRKVPGFGVVTESESTGVPGFGGEATKEDGPRKVPDFSGASGNKSFEQLTLEYGAEAVRQVQDTLRRYDLNRSGVLEADEIQKAKWGRPEPAESDTNQDGKLTREELAARYAGRSASRSRRGESNRDESESRGSRRSGGSSADSGRSGGNDLKSRMERYRERVRAEAEGRKPESSRSEQPDRSSRSGPQTYNAGSERYQRYADALIRQYDKDKDGKLSKEEVSAMRRPPAGADADGDGVITRDELIDSISGATKQQGSASETGASSNDSRSRSSRGSSESSRSNSRSVSFSENDTNGDGQLQMHEFAREWNDEILREFKAKDKNGDGVITRDEWNGR